MSATLLVTGASGKLGRGVIAALRELHDGRIIAASRDVERIRNIEGVEARQANFDEPAGLASAFVGVDRVLLISTDAVGGDGRRVRQHEAAIAAAAAAGVAHVVYTSLTRPEPPAVIAIAPDHHATERALAASGMGWTALRDNLYADLWLEFLRPAMQSGVFAAAAGDGGVGWVTRADCARTAAAVLAKPPAASGALDVTGPALASYAEVAAVAARLTGRTIRYVPVAAEAAAAGMTKAGLPAHVVKLLVSFQVAAAQGELAVVSGTVREFTGASPMPVDEFLAGVVARLAA